MVRSFYEVVIIVNDQGFPDLRVTFFLDSPFESNNSYIEAETIDLLVAYDDRLTVNGTTNGTWSHAERNRIGDVYIDMDARISEGALRELASAPGTTMFTTMDIQVVYTDSEGAKPRTIHKTLTLPVNYREPPTFGLYAAAAAGLGGAGAVGLFLYVGRRARLDELYLMHDSGLLIRHWTKTNGNVHDSDIMSGMFIVLQEFVRDSFKEPHGNLEHLRFGKQQVVMARGNHTVLAAVVRGKYLNGLPRRLQQTVGDFERSYSTILANWSGNVDQFPLADVFALRFIKDGAYGHAA